MGEIIARGTWGPPQTPRPPGDYVQIEWGEVLYVQADLLVRTVNPEQFALARLRHSGCPWPAHEWSIRSGIDRVFGGPATLIAFQCWAPYNGEER